MSRELNLKTKFCRSHFVLPFVCMLSFFSVLAFANENEKKDEGGGHEAPKVEKPWLAAENILSGLRTKVSGLEIALKALIDSRKKVSKSDVAVQIDKQVYDTYAELKKANEELRKQQSIFNYRFPERTAKEGERSYEIQETPTLEKIEEQVGIDGKLKRNLRKLRSQYRIPSNRKKEVAPSVVEQTPDLVDLEVPEVHAPPAKPEESKSIRDQESILLSK